MAPKESKAMKAMAKARAEALLKQDAAQKAGDDRSRAKREPPHSFKVAQGTKMLWLRVTLTKVPSKYLEIQATDSRICVSTPGWSKNFHLDVEYPSKLRCDGDAADAIFEGGLLKVIATPPLSFGAQLTDQIKLPIQNLQSEEDEEEDEDDEEMEEEEEEAPPVPVKKAAKTKGKKRKSPEAGDDKQKLLNMAEQINQSEDSTVAKKKTDMAKTASKLEDKEKAVVEKKKKKSAKQAELDAAVEEAKLAEAKEKKDKKAAKVAAKSAPKKRKVSFGRHNNQI